MLPGVGASEETSAGQAAAGRCIWGLAGLPPCYGLHLWGEVLAPRLALGSGRGPAASGPRYTSLLPLRGVASQPDIPAARPRPVSCDLRHLCLVRHPTVLWYGLLLLSLLLLTRSQFLLMATPLWLALDVLWVVLQERISLPGAFPEYQEYRRVTPMLVPNTRSLRACFASFRMLTSARQAR